jgi:hypothetical protein
MPCCGTHSTGRERKERTPPTWLALGGRAACSSNRRTSELGGWVARWVAAWLLCFSCCCMAAFGRLGSKQVACCCPRCSSQSARARRQEEERQSLRLCSPPDSSLIIRTYSQPGEAGRLEELPLPGPRRLGGPERLRPGARGIAPTRVLSRRRADTRHSLAAPQGRALACRPYSRSPQNHPSTPTPIFAPRSPECRLQGRRLPRSDPSRNEGVLRICCSKSA